MRPALRPEQKRTAKAFVNLTPAERVKVELRAAEINQTVSNYLRLLAIKDCAGDRIKPNWQAMQE